LASLQVGTLAEIWSGPVVLKTWVELLGLCDNFLLFVREELRSIGRSGENDILG
jgi:hypothetical protein